MRARISVLAPLLPATFHKSWFEVTAAYDNLADKSLIEEEGNKLSHAVASLGSPQLGGIKTDTVPGSGSLLTPPVPLYMLSARRNQPVLKSFSTYELLKETKERYDPRGLLTQHAQGFFL